MTSLLYVSNVSIEQQPTQRTNEKEDIGCVALSVSDIHENEELTDTAGEQNMNVTTSILEVNSMNTTVSGQKDLQEVDRVGEDFLSSVKSANKHYVWFSWFRLLLICSIVIPMLAIQMSKLNDDSNTYSTSSFVAIEEIGVPYLLYKASSTELIPSLDYIKLTYLNGTVYSYIGGGDIEFALYINDTLYAIDLDTGEKQKSTYNYDDSTTDNWTLFYIFPSEDELSLTSAFTTILIPPKDLSMGITDIFQVEIIAYSEIIDPSNSILDAEDFIFSMANGLDYGIHYFVDNTYQLKKHGSSGMQYAYEKFANSTSLFALSGQVSFIYMKEIEVIDNTNRGKDNIFYTLTTGISYFDYYNALSGYCMDDEWNIYNVCNNSEDMAGIKITLYFYPNPVRMKSMNVWEYKEGWLDILSNVGGIFSPLLTATGIFLIWFTWGKSVGFARFSGMAPFAGFTDPVFIRQMDEYLAERGLIPFEQKKEMKFTC